MILEDVISYIILDEGELESQLSYHYYILPQRLKNITSQLFFFYL